MGKRFGLAVVLTCLSVFAAERGWTISGNNAKYVRIEGNRLIVEVPKGVTNVCAYATRPVDLSDYAQSMLEAHVRCRGENVVRDPRPARGVKLSLHYVDPVGGERHYPCAKAPEEGSFDWRNLELGVTFGEVPPTADSKAQLVLGLQQTSGRLEFDLSSFSFRKAPPLFPSNDNDYQVRYPERISALPRMRGVMGRGCCRNTEQDIEDLKNYGANLVRLQMNGFGAKRPQRKGEKPKTLADWDKWLARNLDHAEEMLGWLEKRDMKMVLDLHNPPLNGYGRDGDVFYVQANADRLVSVWREIAARFKGRKGIYGYDIMNEPAQTRRALPDCDYWNLQRRAAEAIRAVDPDATIIVESNDWDGPGAFGYLKALEMDNVIYQVHMYRPGAFTHQGANGAARPAPDKLVSYPNPAKGWDKEFLRRQLEPVLQFQKRHNAKIFVGEFSACIYGPGAGDYLADCISIFEEYGWDWTYHSFREALWWNVETVIDEKTGKPVPDKDNPRFRALVDGFKGVTASSWTFKSAPLAARPSTGRELSAGVHELRVPDRGGCGWWSTERKIAPRGGVRFRATVEIAIDDAKDYVYNDLMMFVRWDFPKNAPKTVKRKGTFFQRDFVVYTDRVEYGRIVRTFDETYPVPEDSDAVEIEFIGKWHAMTAVIRDVQVENVPRPKPRVARCVVGNPHESTGNRIIAERRRAGEEMDGAKTMAVQLAQIEICLTNIFAHVEKPDIILFSECLASQGARDNSEVTEPIPGGPSWKLAEKYATKYSCNIAMDVKERDENGQCHNTIFVCDRKGRLAGRFRKVHLTSGEYQQGLVAGNDYPIFDLDFGRVGALVCWDNWFAESIKMVKRNGAELLLFPLAGCAEDHVDITFPSRAIDAGIPILVAMRQGHLPNGIIDRDGTWIAKTFEDCGYAVADLDLSERKRTFWLSVGAGQGDPYELYFDESRPEVYEKFDWRQPRK